MSPEFPFNIRTIGDRPEGRENAKRTRLIPRSPFRPSASKGLVERIRGWILGAWTWIRGQKQRLGWTRFLLRMLGLLILLFGMYVLFLWLTLPNLLDPANLFAAQSTVITDRNGVELYRIHGEQDRTVVPGDQIASSVKHAIVAIEDARFQERGCIDWRAMGRAIFLLGQRGGASTLTRQLARNALNLRSENVLSRKIKELILGCELEARFSKENLLTLYLNWIPFGQNAYGVEQASERYFGIKAKDLTLAQSAVLASLPQQPSYFNPYGRHVHTTVSDGVLQRILKGAIKHAGQIPDSQVTIGLLGASIGTGSTTVYVGGRADQVLHNMQAQGYITLSDLQKATEELRHIVFKPSRESIRAPHFVLWVKDQVEQMVEQTGEKGLLEQGGLTIQTTLDWKLQQAAEKAVADHSEDSLKRFGAHNIALVALAPRTREVLAYVGNADFGDKDNAGKVDMAQAPRQPGSSFKPFVYSAAFEQGYSPATPLYDVPTKFGTDQPQNFDGTWWGLTTARRALGGSRNIPAIKAFFLAGGEEPVLDLASKFGVETPLIRKEELQKERGTFDYGWPLAIGAAETPLLDMVEGYSTLADQGMKLPVVSIRKVTNSKGAILQEAEQNPVGDQVLDPRIAYQVTSILSDPSARPGEFWQSALTVPGFPAAAKTGTSNKCMDKPDAKADKNKVCNVRKPESLWTLGYTPDIAAGVWVGNANSTALSDKADGLNVAAPIWRAFMGSALKIHPPSIPDFPVPDGLVQPQISLLSGELPTECTPIDLRISDVFLREHAPVDPDPACVQLLVDRVTGLLASESCPTEAAETRSFLVPHSVLADRWPLWEQGVQDWVQGRVKASTGGTISGLPLPPAPTEKCDITKTPGRLVRPTLTILSPTNDGTVSYPTFQPKIFFSVGQAVHDVSYSIDGKQMDDETNAPFKAILHVPRSIDRSVSHSLAVTVTDSYFNQMTETVSFRFGENTGIPQVQITSPAKGSVLSKTGSGLTITADASDESGIKYVEFYLDDLLLGRTPREPYTVTYPLTTVSPGPHRIRAVATDPSGKAGEDEEAITVNP
ncbi:transglycosylase domain-containing protein [Candidatus Peregrinibacteria bacterium]|nr:transglycosylase domain-containing protein [Candidatus Peregrinibacteria bacterium]